MSAASSSPAAELRALLGGQAAPLAAQYAYDLLRTLPPAPRRHPGSAAFRQAMRDRWAAQPVELLATRADIAHGVHFLAAAGLLPADVWAPDYREASR